MVVPIVDELAALPELLRERGSRRIVVLTGRSRRFVDRLPLGQFEVTSFDQAIVHVPRDTVAAALAALDQAKADTILSLGGGAATGLGKALRLERDVGFIAIPTTYAGSEQTAIWGVREEGRKHTGRDDRVRPDAIVYDNALFAEIPRKLTVTSLMNALAHPISALTTEALRDRGSAEGIRALDAIHHLVWALEQLALWPRSEEARREALQGAIAAAEILDRAPLGRHHQLAHYFGGLFELDHASIHSVLLPHFVGSIARSDGSLYEAIVDAAGHADLPAALFDLLRRVGAPGSLLDLAVPANEVVDAIADGSLEPWVEDVLLGRRPSVEARRGFEAGRPATAYGGAELVAAERVIIAFHGRGSTAERMLEVADQLTGCAKEVAVVAPQAPGGLWYRASYRASNADQHGDLDRSLQFAERLIDRVVAEQGDGSRVFLLGFSQGACLATELFCRLEHKLGGLVALSGARPLPVAEQPPVAGRREGSPVLLGVSEGDGWIVREDVELTAALFAGAGASVTLDLVAGGAHEITARQRLLARAIFLGSGSLAVQRGFGNVHESEALEGALPRRQNSPRHVPYGLYAEQLNGTGFTVERRANLRTWLYRIRPSAQHSAFEPLVHRTFRDDWQEGGADPNLAALRPLPLPEEAVDFVDGLHTVGGAGDPSLRRGFAIHLYGANRSMEHRAVYNADGDLLIVPELGGLTMLTELGALELRPGQIAILPRGLKASFLLQGKAARGYVAEVFERHFVLPERGPVGANGLAEPRHFCAPSAWFEDRLDPGYRITVKSGGALFEARQDYSPFDVVAWHGDYVPYVYDLDDFSPVGNVRFDHADPSVHLVLSASMDEPGSNTLDFVFFPPRWDPTEGTFRPPFFHRNATTEVNGIIADPSLSAAGSTRRGESLASPFAPGCLFLTPSMTAHGVRARSVQSELGRSDEQADRPVRIPDGSKWFQFESALAFHWTTWARSSPQRIADWPSIWGAHRPCFRPPTTR